MLPVTCLCCLLSTHSYFYRHVVPHEEQVGAHVCTQHAHAHSRTHARTAQTALPARQRHTLHAACHNAGDGRVDGRGARAVPGHGAGARRRRQVGPVCDAHSAARGVSVLRILQVGWDRRCMRLFGMRARLLAQIQQAQAARHTLARWRVACRVLACLACIPGTCASRAGWCWTAASASHAAGAPCLSAECLALSERASAVC